MTTTQLKEFTDICEKADESTIDLFWDVAICVQCGGDAFWDEAQAFLDKGDRTGLIATVSKWAAIVKGAAV